MSRSNVTLAEALQRLLDATKQIDFADCKDERVWQAIGDAQGTAEGVLRDGVEQKPVAWWRYSYIDEDGSHDLDMYYGDDPTKHYAPSAHPWNALYAEPVAAQTAVAPASVPTGWKLVPIEPTPEMTASAMTGAKFDPKLAGMFISGLIANYRKMLAAAPSIAAPTEVERDAARFVFEHTQAEAMIHIEMKALSLPPGQHLDWYRKEIDAAISTGEKYE